MFHPRPSDRVLAGTGGTAAAQTLKSPPSQSVAEYGTNLDCRLVRFADARPSTIDARGYEG